VTFASASSVKGAAFGDRPYSRIAEFGEVADLAGSFPGGSTAERAERGVVGMLAAMRRDCAGTGLGTGDCQRGVATIRMAHHPDSFALDVRSECSVFQNRINDAGYLLRSADPHADTGYVVTRSSWVCGRRDDVALPGECHREISVEQGHAA
jgi:hypothetical protein